MKAVLYTRYGSPDELQMAEVPKPTPKAGEVLVKIHATAINSADARLLRGKPFLVRFMGYGLFSPRYRILGCDVAGRVEAVGEGVTAFNVGDAVYGDLSEHGMGGFAEYVSVSQTALAPTPMPTQLNDEEAAALPLAGVTALQALKKAQVKAGERVAINGASGGVGTLAVQLAHALGAEVTAIASASKLDMLRELGATHVIDYAQEDFTAQAGQYDVILGVNGYHPIANYARALKDGGRYVMVGGADAQLFEALLHAPFVSWRTGKHLSSLIAKTTRDDLLALNEWVARGALKPVIERRYALQDLQEALRTLEMGHARGKLVISLSA